MVVKCAGLEKQSLSMTVKQRTILKQQADGMTPDTILAGLDVLVSSKSRLRFTSHGRIVFEMALVRLCRLENLVPITQLVQWVSENGANSVTNVRPKQQQGLASPSSSTSTLPAPEK